MSPLHGEGRQFDPVTMYQTHIGVIMSKSKDVINRAYGNISKEVTPIIEFNLFPTWRGIKYYYIMLKRKMRV